MQKISIIDLAIEKSIVKKNIMSTYKYKERILSLSKKKAKKMTVSAKDEADAFFDHIYFNAYHAGITLALNDLINAAIDLEKKHDHLIDKIKSDISHSILDMLNDPRVEEIIIDYLSKLVNEKQKYKILIPAHKMHLLTAKLQKKNIPIEVVSGDNITLVFGKSNIIFSPERIHIPELTKYSNPKINIKLLNTYKTVIDALLADKSTDKNEDSHD